jgi:hypothetical protein
MPRILHSWKSLPKTAVKTVMENTILCVIVFCIVTSCVLKCPINTITKPNPSGLRGLEVMFPPHDPSDAGSNPAEVIEFLRTEKFREQVLREGL